ncbi:MAG: nuclear transport factor 2 family protein [Gemmatimonadaceae bacterium]|nr:nuclear transport factor 2 family protein [Gemmatimonadaceae bacterium]
MRHALGPRGLGLLVGAWLALGTPSARAQSTAARSAGARGPAEVQAVLSAEQALLQAMSARDRAALERLLAPQFLLVSAAEGERIPRSAWVAGLLDRRSVDAGVLESAEGRVHAPGVVTLVARVRWTVRDGATLVEQSTYDITDTWVRRGARWQLAARHSSIPRPSRDP